MAIAENVPVQEQLDYVKGQVHSLFVALAVVINEQGPEPLSRLAVRDALQGRLALQRMLTDETGMSLTDAALIDPKAFRDGQRDGFEFILGVLHSML